MTLFEKFNEPFTRKISNRDYEVTFIGVCKEKEMLWGKVNTEDGEVDLLIPIHALIVGGKNV